jgi:hypothetical protein
VAEYYTVTQGDHLSSIADEFGFPDYKPVWNHPENAELKAKRKNPHVLLAGDQVYIPDIQPGAYDKPTDVEHKFVVAGKPLQMELRLERAYYQPLAKTPCDVPVGAGTKLSTDGNGAIRLKIGKREAGGNAVIHEKAATPVLVKIGYLDPVEETTGQLQRLANLGYYRGSLEARDADEFESAVQEFQCDHGLTVEGVCGAGTQAKLKQIHGG